jgi:hypothetical protein
MRVAGGSVNPAMILLALVACWDCAPVGVIDMLTMQPPHRIIDLVRLLASGAFNRAIARTRPTP